MQVRESRLERGMGQLGRQLLLQVQVERSRDLRWGEGPSLEGRPTVNPLRRPARAGDGGRAAKRLESHVPDQAFVSEADLHPNQGALRRPPCTAGADVLGVERQRPEEPGRPEVREEEIGGTAQGGSAHGPASARFPCPRRSSQ